MNPKGFCNKFLTRLPVTFHEEPSGAHPHEYTRFVLAMVPNGENIVDIGCGKGIYGFLLRTHEETARYMVGVDIERRHLLFCLKHKIYDDVILADATCLPFRKSSFQIVLACDVIEHIEKSKGKVFLKELERICNGRIILTTPNGTFPFSLESYPYETHKSTYSSPELIKFGYKVFGIGFKDFLKLGRMGLLGKFLGWALFYFFTPIAILFPRIGQFLICSKDCDKKR